MLEGKPYLEGVWAIPPGRSSDFHFDKFSLVPPFWGTQCVPALGQVLPAFKRLSA